MLTNGTSQSTTQRTKHLARIEIPVSAIGVRLASGVCHEEVKEVVTHAPS